MSETELTPDAVLLAARDQARAALAEITDPAMIGADAGYEVEEAHVLTLLFECRLAGYPGWRWAATLARTSEDAPVTVLEVELLPGPDSVIAPDWVPWSERLAQYREGHAKQADAAGDPHDDEAADAEDDELENDFDDDLDGVDLDEDADAFDDDSDGDDTDDDDSEDEDIDDDSDDADLFDEDTDDVDDESDDDSEGDDSEDDDSEE